MLSSLGSSFKGSRSSLFKGSRSSLFKDSRSSLFKGSRSYIPGGVCRSCGSTSLQHVGWTHPRRFLSGEFSLYFSKNKRKEYVK